ncbi:LCP family protein [Terrisporobacter sp.]
MSKLIRRIKFIFMTIGLIVVVVAIATFTNLFSNKNTKELPTSTEVKSNLNNNLSNKDNLSNAINILLFGDNNNSMMIASVDAENKNIKLTPIKNNTYIDTSDKEGLLKSIEKNTNLNLNKFLKVNLSDLMNAVPVLGNIKVDVNKKDLQLINNLIPKFYAECENYNKGDMKLISKDGTQNLNGYQAMAYATVISKDINKQKEMLISLVNSIKNANFTKYIELFNTLKPYIDTNLTIPDMLKLASTDYKFY